MIRTLLLTLLLAAAASAQTPTPLKPADVKYDPKANPEADLKAALKRASKDHKNVLLDVGGEWCSWCHRMDKFLGDHQALLDLLDASYVVVKVNFSEENQNERFLARYPKVEGYPHLFVLDSKGRLLESKNTGDLEEGKGYNLGRFQEFLAKYAAKR